jgi:hypothetical protein
MGQREVKSLSPVVDPTCRFPWILRVAEPKHADRKSSGTFDVLEVPVVIGGYQGLEPPSAISAVQAVRPHCPA